MMSEKYLFLKYFKIYNINNFCKFVILRLSCLLFFMLSCHTEKTPLMTQLEKPLYYTRTITGYVQMEHQTNHDNCAVFLDQVNIGTYTDSLGFYSLTLPDSVFENDTMIVQGTVQLYFYSFNYFLDSLQIALGSKGMILDSLALDKDGIVENKLVKQQFSIQLETDTTFYIVGDTVSMKMYMKKYGEGQIEITVPELSSPELGPVLFLYEDINTYFKYANPYPAEASYIWQDTSLIWELHGAWTSFTQDIFNDWPVGNYYVIPFVRKTYKHIPKWWKMPENLEYFLPSPQFANFNYLYHPKKFNTPLIYLDSLTTKN